LVSRPLAVVEHGKLFAHLGCVSVFCEQADSLGIVLSLNVVQSASFARRYANGGSIRLSQVGPAKGNAVDEVLASI
jgi:hypothetical protein